MEKLPKQMSLHKKTCHILFSRIVFFKGGTHQMPASSNRQANVSGNRQAGTLQIVVVVWTERKEAIFYSCFECLMKLKVRKNRQVVVSSRKWKKLLSKRMATSGLLQSWNKFLSFMFTSRFLRLWNQYPWALAIDHFQQQFSSSVRTWKFNFSTCDIFR